MEYDGNAACWAPAGHAPCLFPILNAGSSQDDARASVAVPVVGLCMANFCAEHPVSPLQLLQVTWGIVLRSYTATNEPWFLCRDGGSSSIDCDPEFYVCVDLSNDRDVLTLVKETKSRSSSPKEGRSLRSNTAVIRHCSSDITQDDGYTKSLSSVCINIHELGRGLDISLQYQTSVLSENQAATLRHLISHVVLQMTNGPVSLHSINMCPCTVHEHLAKWSQKPLETVSHYIHDLILNRCGA